MEKMGSNPVKSAAVQQWKKNLPLWISGVTASAVLVCVAMCLAFQEKGWHIVLIAACTGIALFLVGKKSVCPDSVSRELLRESGIEGKQMKSVLHYQMVWLYLVSVPLGVAAGLLVRPLLPWA